MKKTCLLVLVMVLITLLGGGCSKPVEVKPAVERPSQELLNECTQASLLKLAKRDVLENFDMFFVLSSLTYQLAEPLQVAGPTERVAANGFKQQVFTVNAKTTGNCVVSGNPNAFMTGSTHHVFDGNHTYYLYKDEFGGWKWSLDYKRSKMNVRPQ